MILYFYNLLSLDFHRVSKDFCMMEVSKSKANRLICHSEACRLRSRHQGRVGGCGADATLI